MNKMRAELPLEIYGLVSPILSWVEGTRSAGSAAAWAVSDASGSSDRATPRPFERAWLSLELPNYSHDNLDEIIEVARPPRSTRSRPSWLYGRTQTESPALDPPADFSIPHALRQLSRRYLQWIGPELCIREGLVVEAHELGVRFPVRHLLRFTHAEAVVRGHLSRRRACELSDRLSTLPCSYASLRSTIEKGVSEGHLHLNAILSGEESWDTQIASQVIPTSWDGTPVPGARRLVVMGRAAARLMAIGLCHEHARGKGETVELEPLVTALKQLDRVYWARTDLEEHRSLYELRRLLAESARAAIRSVRRDMFGDLQWLLQLVMPSGSEHSADAGSWWCRGGIRTDSRVIDRLHFFVIETLVRYSYAVPDGRAGWARRVNEWMWKNPQWSFLHQVFFRYLVYQTHHWQRSVQQGRTTGLKHFKKFFDSRFRRSVEDVDEAGSFAFDRMVQDPSLREVEGRLSPPVSHDQYMPWVLSYVDNYELGNIDRFGIIVHFIKDDGKRSLARSEVGHTSIMLRQGRIRRTLRRQAFQFFRKLSTPDSIVPFIVGFDAANAELHTPPEIFAPAFRFLRELPIEVVQRSMAKDDFGLYGHIFDRLHGRRLGMTYHVGEEFRHILSGLRAIFEAIEFLSLRPGDRIGHGTALALDPDVWAAHIGYQSVLPKQEWLDTLVWIRYFLGSGHDLIGELGVEDVIQKLWYDIYAKRTGDRGEWSIPTLHDAWRLRQLDPHSIDVIHLVRGSLRFRPPLGRGVHHKRWADVQELVYREVSEHIGSPQAYEAAALYWFDPGVQAAGEELITVQMHEHWGEWLQVCREVQARLQKIVREKELVVEVNPSSNRFIGPMSSYGEHHVFALTVDERRQGLEKVLRVTVNTDNPGVLSTSLAHEYYMIAEERMRAGASEAEVTEWIDWLRTNSRDYSFLRHAPDPETPQMRELLTSLTVRHAALLRRMKGDREQLPRCVREFLESRRLEPLVNARVFEQHWRSPRTLRRFVDSARQRLPQRRRRFS